MRVDISDLKEREASFRLLFEAHPQPMYVFAYDSLRFLAVNDAALAQYGYTREQFLGLTILDLRPPEDRERFLVLLKGFRDHSVEEGLRHQRSDGGIFETAVYSRRLMYEGRAARLASVIDITERRQAERERDRNREFLDLIIDNVPITILVKEARNRQYMLLNRAGEDLWQQSRDQVIGKTAYELFPKPRADLINAHDEQALRSDVPFVLGEHKTYVRADDERIVTSKTFAIRGDDGAAQYLVSVVEDVTERRRAEDERDRNRQFLEQIIDNVPLPIVVKDARERKIALVNRAIEQFWSLPRAQALGKTVYDLFSRNQAETITSTDDEAVRSHTPIFLDAHPNYSAPDDKRIVTSTKACLRDQGGQPQYLISVVEDITARRHMEQQLLQAQKMEAVGNLTGGLAHDFNNLLTIIIGNLDLLRDQVGSNGAAQQKISAILEASLRGADLTGRMLAFSRRQTLQPKLLDINQLIANTTVLLARVLGGEIRVEVRAAADLWAVRVDETQLQTALVNVAINARDAMPNGGRLTIVTNNVSIDREDASAELGRGDYAVIEISDTGTGMKPDVLERVFEPFFTTKSAGKGTGLGLSMVYGFVRQSGGHVSAETQDGVGTTFKLFLPRATSAPPIPVAVEAKKKNGAVARGEVILVVDDDRDVRGAVVGQLRTLGYQVLDVESVPAALAVLASSQNIDLLFTDISMPGGMNGRELAIKARAMRPGLRVLFTSAFPRTSPETSAELALDGPLLTKPYRREQLAKAIGEALHAESAAAE